MLSCSNEISPLAKQMFLFKACQFSGSAGISLLICLGILYSPEFCLLFVSYHSQFTWPGELAKLILDFMPEGILLTKCKT